MIGKNRGKTRPLKRRARKGDALSNDENLHVPQNPLIVSSRSVIPHKVGSELSTTQFADGVEPRTVNVVLQCKFCKVGCIV